MIQDGILVVIGLPLVVIVEEVRWLSIWRNNGTISEVEREVPETGSLFKKDEPKEEVTSVKSNVEIVEEKPAGGVKFCPNCGTPAEGGNFCTNCGNKLR